MILEALADVEEGRVIDNDTALAWIESLGTDNPLPMPKPRV